MIEQKFKRGDVVHIAADLGQSMSHFEKDKDAVVMGSYAEQFGGDDTKSYTLMFFQGNGSSWYEEHQLTFLRHGGEEIINEINKKAEEREKIESNLSWIVENWKEIRTGDIPSATIVKLMSFVGITDPWGNHGEGIDYYNHVRYTLKQLDPVLLTGDIEKVKQFIAGIKEE